MVKIINIFGDQYSGQAGKAGVFAKWKGRQYRRAYVIPANPKTTMQQIIRGYFTNAVDAWHGYSGLQRLVYSYLASGLVMSGFNLLVRRWMVKATAKLDTPEVPLRGIKQIASASETNTDEVLVWADGVAELTNAPAQIGSLTYVPGATSLDCPVLIDLDMGDLRVPVAIMGTAGETESPVEALAPKDQLVISYTAQGRTVTREILYTVPTGESTIPVTALIDQLRTEFSPVDFASVKFEIFDESLGEDNYAIIEGLEIVANITSIADTTPTYKAKIKPTKTAPTAADDEASYVSYTPLADAKLELTKQDTSFITWRRYSDVAGYLPLAQTIEDQSYDWSLSVGLYVSIIRAAQSAKNASKHELVKMTAVS
ncbi:hypothetical protein ES708_19719 [subsurface metagenome]